MGNRGCLVLPSGLAQTFEHVGMVFETMPRHAPPDIHVKGSRRDSDGFFKRFLCFGDSPELSECSSKPTIWRRKIRI